MPPSVEDHCMPPNVKVVEVLASGKLITERVDDDGRQCSGRKRTLAASKSYSYVAFASRAVAVLRWGEGGTGPQNLAQAPQFFPGNLGTVVLLLVDVIGSIVISLSRCCLPNDEGPALPQYFFLEPPLV